LIVIRTKTEEFYVRVPVSCHLSIIPVTVFSRP